MKKYVCSLKGLLCSLLVLTLMMAMCSCGSEPSVITSGTFTGNFREDGAIIMKGNVYVAADSLDCDFSNSIYNRGWIGEQGKKMPKDADANADLVNGVLLLLDDSDTVYCREDHYDAFVAELNAERDYDDLYFTFLVNFSTSYRYYLSAEQDAALADVFATVTPVAASTVFAEVDGLYSYDGGVPLIAKIEDSYFDHMYWSSILYVADKYYMVAGFADPTFPRRMEGDSLVYPVPEKYNELMGAIFECKGGKVTADSDDATEDLSATTTASSAMTTGFGESTTTVATTV